MSEVLEVPTTPQSSLLPSPSEEKEEEFALETRAEEIDVVAYGVSLRVGELDQVEAGEVEDDVSHAENLLVGGRLHEQAESATTKAIRERLQVDGRLAFKATGDMTLLAGTLSDIQTGGVAVVSGMADDMVGGVGSRLSAGVDMWLSGLTGIEEQPGSAAMDGMLAEMAATAFEREYGAGSHMAGVAVFSGAVYTTMATSFFPMIKAIKGVRNLVPGGGAGAGGGGGGAAGVAAVPAITGMMATLARGARNSGKLGDLVDLSKVADAAEDAFSAARRVPDAATVLDEMQTLARRSETGADASDAAEVMTRVARTVDVDDAGDVKAGQLAADPLPDLPRSEVDSPLRQTDNVDEPVSSSRKAPTDDLGDPNKLPDDFDGAYDHLVSNMHTKYRSDANNFRAHRHVMGVRVEVVGNAQRHLADALGVDAGTLGDVGPKAARAQIVGLMEDAVRAGDIEQAATLRKNLELLDSETRHMILEVYRIADDIIAASKQPLPKHIDQQELAAKLQREIERLGASMADAHSDDMQDISATMVVYHGALVDVENGMDPVPAMMDNVSSLITSEQDSQRAKGAATAKAVEGVYSLVHEQKKPSFLRRLFGLGGRSKNVSSLPSNWLDDLVKKYRLPTVGQGTDDGLRRVAGQTDEVAQQADEAGAGGRWGEDPTFRQAGQDSADEGSRGGRSDYADIDDFAADEGSRGGRSDYAVIDDFAADEGSRGGDARAELPGEEEPVYATVDKTRKRRKPAPIPEEVEDDVAPPVPPRTQASNELVSSGDDSRRLGEDPTFRQAGQDSADEGSRGGRSDYADIDDFAADEGSRGGRSDYAVIDDFAADEGSRGGDARAELPGEEEPVYATVDKTRKRRKPAPIPEEVEDDVAPPVPPRTQASNELVSSGDDSRRLGEDPTFRQADEENGYELLDGYRIETDEDGDYRILDPDRIEADEEGDYRILDPDRIEADEEGDYRILDPDRVEADEEGHYQTLLGDYRKAEADEEHVYEPVDNYRKADGDGDFRLPDERDDIYRTDLPNSVNKDEVAATLRREVEHLGTRIAAESDPARVEAMNNARSIYTRALVYVENGLNPRSAVLDHLHALLIVKGKKMAGMEVLEAPARAVGHVDRLILPKKPLWKQVLRIGRGKKDVPMGRKQWRGFVKMNVGPEPVGSPLRKLVPKTGDGRQADELAQQADEAAIGRRSGEDPDFRQTDEENGYELLDGYRKDDPDEEGHYRILDPDRIEDDEAAGAARRSPTDPLPEPPRSGEDPTFRQGYEEHVYEPVDNYRKADGDGDFRLPDERDDIYRTDLPNSVNKDEVAATLRREVEHLGTRIAAESDPARVEAMNNARSIYTRALVYVENGLNPRSAVLDHLHALLIVKGKKMAGMEVLEAPARAVGHVDRLILPKKPLWKQVLRIGRGKKDVPMGRKQWRGFVKMNVGPEPVGSPLRKLVPKTGDGRQADELAQQADEAAIGRRSGEDPDFRQTDEENGYELLDGYRKDDPDEEGHYRILDPDRIEDDEAAGAASAARSQSGFSADGHVVDVGLSDMPPRSDLDAPSRDGTLRSPTDPQPEPPRSPSGGEYADESAVAHLDEDGARWKKPDDVATPDDSLPLDLLPSRSPSQTPLRRPPAPDGDVMPKGSHNTPDLGGVSSSPTARPLRSQSASPANFRADADIPRTLEFEEPEFIYEHIWPVAGDDALVDDSVPLPPRNSADRPPTPIREGRPRTLEFEDPEFIYQHIESVVGDNALVDDSVPPSLPLRNRADRPSAPRPEGAERQLDSVQDQEGYLAPANRPAVADEDPYAEVVTVGGRYDRESMEPVSSSRKAPTDDLGDPNKLPDDFDGAYDHLVSNMHTKYRSDANNFRAHRHVMGVRVEVVGNAQRHLADALGVDAGTLGDVGPKAARAQIVGLMEDAVRAGDIEQAATLRKNLELLDSETRHMILEVYRIADDIIAASKQPLPKHIDQQELAAKLQREIERLGASMADAHSDDMQDISATMVVYHGALVDVENGMDPVPAMMDNVSSLITSEQDSQRAKGAATAKAVEGVYSLVHEQKKPSFLRRLFGLGGRSKNVSSLPSNWLDDLVKKYRLPTVGQGTDDGLRRVAGQTDEVAQQADEAGAGGRWGEDPTFRQAGQDSADEGSRGGRSDYADIDDFAADEGSRGGRSDYAVIDDFAADEGSRGGDARAELPGEEEPVYATVDKTRKRRKPAPIPEEVEDDVAPPVPPRTQASNELVSSGDDSRRLGEDPTFRQAGQEGYLAPADRPAAVDEEDPYAEVVTVGGRYDRESMRSPRNRADRPSTPRPQAEGAERQLDGVQDQEGYLDPADRSGAGAERQLDSGQDQEGYLAPADRPAAVDEENPYVEVETVDGRYDRDKMEHPPPPPRPQAEGAERQLDSVPDQEGHLAPADRPAAGAEQQIDSVPEQEGYLAPADRPAAVDEENPYVEVETVDGRYDRDKMEHPPPPPRPQAEGAERQLDSVPDQEGHLAPADRPAAGAEQQIDSVPEQEGYLAPADRPAAVDEENPYVEVETVDGRYDRDKMEHPPPPPSVKRGGLS